MTLSAQFASFEARIENLLKRADEAGLDDELRSSLSRYACVLTSGYVEEGVRQVLRVWCGTKAHPTIDAYVNRQLQWFYNAKTGKILELLSHFSDTWRQQFDAVLTDEERDAIDSVVNNKNQIAHGKDVGLSSEPMKRYFKACRSAVAKMNKVVNGP
jgi:hypothetical protein